MSWLLVSLIVFWGQPTPGASSAQVDCVTLAPDDRLIRGSRFVYPLPRNLEFRLSPAEFSTGASSTAYGWNISVGPAGAKDDFLWVVSPPYQTAPHLQLGAGYGLSVDQSVAIKRELAFVLSRASYNRAVEIVNSENAVEAKQTMLRQLGVGSLTINVTGHAVTKVPSANGEVEALDWITFNGRACVPR